MFGEVRRGGRAREAYPQQSTAVIGPSENSGNLGGVTGVRISKFLKQQVPEAIRRGCHASANRSSVYPPAQALPGGSQICCRGPRWGRWPFACVFALFGAARRPADQCSVRCQQACRVQRARSAGQARPEPVEAVRGSDEKNYAGRRNHTATPELIIGAGRSPQPLTLNHPASNPGRISGRGSSLWDLGLRYPIQRAQRSRRGTRLPVRHYGQVGVESGVFERVEARPGVRTRPFAMAPGPSSRARAIRSRPEPAASADHTASVSAPTGGARRIRD
jgi:hypothetical protein